MADLRVLVVDDEQTVRHVLKEFFRRRGDHCDIAANGADALLLVQDRIYDLMLSDVSMPGIDGLELTRRVKALQPYTVCVLMSGLGTRGDVVAALKIGVFDFIDKPFLDLAALGLALDRAAESGRLTRERDALLQTLREQNSRLEYSLLRLHEAFGQMRQQEAALASDLQKAQRVQRTFLPAGFPRTPGFDFFGYYAPCDQLGGDLFGTLPLSDGRLALYLVDVAGHGVSAAMITVTFRELMRAGHRSAHDSGLFGNPADVLHSMNAALLREKFEPPVFVSMIYAVIDPRTGDVSVASAGHPAPVLMSGPDQAATIPTEGTVLGARAAADYAAVKLHLPPGAALLFYSDGLSEARNTEGHEFSATRLQTIMAQQHARAAGAIAGELERHLLDHLQGTPSSDDVTFLIAVRDQAPSPATPAESGDIVPDSVKIVMPDKLRPVRPRARGQMHAGFRDNTCIVQVSGVVTWQFGPALRDMLDAAGARATPPFLIDLAECEALDSTMLGLLLQNTAGLVLHQPGRRVFGQLHEMGVLRLFTISHEPCPRPQVAMALTPSGTQQACSDLILSAHEVLMEASASNREKFKDVVDSLRHDQPNT